MAEEVTKANEVNFDRKKWLGFIFNYTQ